MYDNRRIAPTRGYVMPTKVNEINFDLLQPGEVVTIRTANPYATHTIYVIKVDVSTPKRDKKTDQQCTAYVMVTYANGTNRKASHRDTRVTTLARVGELFRFSKNNIWESPGKIQSIEVGV